MGTVLVSPVADFTDQPVVASIRIPTLTDDQFFDLCNENDLYRFERTAKGDLVIMPGTGGKTGNRNAALTSSVYSWAVADRRGVAFNSSTHFRLPSSALLSPDNAWVPRARLANLTERDKERIVPFCPDFVIELTSPSDRLTAARKKMREWMEGGCQLGWLIHPRAREVYVYRPSGEERLQGVDELRGEAPVDGLILDLKPIWDPDW